MTRSGTLTAIAATLIACAVAGGSASADVARENLALQGAGQYAAVRSHPGAFARAASTHARRKSSPCSTAHKRARSRRAGCRTTPVRAKTPRAPRPTRTTPPHKTAAVTIQPPTSAAAAIAKVLATPCQNTQLTPEPGNLPAVRAAVLCLINTERAQNGEEPLVPDSRLEAAAESHGKEMLALDYFAHVSPSGQTPVERVRTTGYIPNSEVGYVIGENLAWGTLTLSTPQAIVNAWIASPEHLANILESKYRDTGIDVQPQVPESLAEGVAGALYTQEFGVIVH